MVFVVLNSVRNVDETDDDDDGRRGFESDYLGNEREWNGYDKGGDGVCQSK